MKKMTGVVCVMALISSMAVTVSANPSIHSVISENRAVAIVESSYTTVELTEEKVIVKEAEESIFQEHENIQKVISMLKEKENVYTTAELLDTVGVELEETVLTTKENEIIVEKLEPITTMTAFVYEESGERLADGKIEAVIQGGEATKGEKKENLIVVQFEIMEEVIVVHFVEMEELQEDGTYRAQFPCTGPFFVAYVTE